MAKHKMKRKTKVILGVVTVFVVAGALVGNHFRGGAEAHADRFVSHIEEEYKLDSEQSQALRELKNLVMEIRRDAKASRAQNINQVMDLVFEPTLDQQQAVAMVEEKTALINDRSVEVIAAMASFTDQLTPSQKQRMQSRIQDKMDRWNRWHD